MSNIFVPKRLLCCIAGLLAILISQPKLYSDSPSTVPAMSPEDKLAQQLENADKDHSDAMKEFLKYVPTMEDLFDSSKNKAFAPDVIPLLRRMISDFVVLSQVDSEAKYAIIQYKAILVYLGDNQTLMELKETAKGNSDDATGAKFSMVLAAWWNTSKDAAAQTKVVADFQKLVQSNSPTELCVITGMNMLDRGAASEDQTTAVLKILTDDVKSPVGAEAAAQFKAEKEADAKLVSLENKPMTISGKQVDGKVFSTDSWKGKVVLVDFWATWCAPCVARMPQVSKVYSDYHAKGLEIVGVSSDYQPDLLAKFLSDHKEMGWTQLFDPAAASNEKYHPVAEAFGVTMLPEMFLIDKNGICRTVKARDNFEELIPKLLAE